MRSLLLSFFLLQACHTDPTEVGTSPVALEATVASPEDSPVDEAVNPALALQIRASAGDDLVPTQIVFVTAKAVFAGHAHGEAAPVETEFVLEPAIPGELRVESGDQLTFVPRDGFRPGTSYKVEVRSYGDATNKVVPPQPWTLAFEAPPFAYVRSTLRSRDVRAAIFAVDAVFSAAVDPDEVARRIAFSVNEEPLRPTRAEPGDTPNTVRFTFARRLPIDQETSLTIKLQRGTPWNGDKRLLAPAARETLTVGHGPLMEIKKVALKETGSGFHIDITCDDDAAPGARRSFYDRATWDWYDDLSSRCLLSESSLARTVRTVPATPLQISSTLSGFRLSGRFTRGPLSLEIDAGATTIDGGVVTNGTQQSLVVPSRTPSLRFVQAGRYLPRSAWTNLGVQHLNTPDVRVQVRHVRPENLVFWMTGNEPTDARTSDLVTTAELGLNGPSDEETTSWIDVGGIVPTVLSGLYEISVSSPSSSASATSRLVLTDIQLVAKADAPEPGSSWPEHIAVWALDAHTTQGMADVDISVVRASGQSMGQCRTRSDGGCSLPLKTGDLDSSPPVALLARKGADLTFLEFEDLQIQNTEADVAGAPYAAASPYIASVLTDRGVMRPGETMHVTAIVRDSTLLAAQALPVVLKVIDPLNRESRRIATQTNEGGMVVADIPSGDYATTGRYRISAEVGDVAVGEASFQVEEFVPERMKVEASAAPAIQLAGEPVDIKVDAHWLFGGKAKGSKTELRCRLEPATFSPAAAKGYAFGPARIDAERPRALTLETAGGTLDDEGAGTFSCPPTAHLGGMGPATLIAEVAVLEGESGRTTVSQARATIQPERYAIGLKTGASKARRGQTFHVQGLVADWEGKPVATPPGELTVDIFHMEEEFSWWWDEEEGDSRQTRILRRARDDRQTLATNGKATFDLTVTPSQDSAGTLVVVHSGAATTELFIEGSSRSYWWQDEGSVVDATPKPARPTPLLLELPKTVEVGETVKVSTNAPYRGRILWTVETDKVLRKAWSEVAEAGPLSWSFPVETLTPNLYVTALLVKDPHLESEEAFLPDRAYGIASVDVAPTPFLHKLTIRAPKEVRPYSPLDVDLDLGPLTEPAFVTVAAVDEGVLQLTKFADPDPTRAIFAKRALGVHSYETIGWTLLSQPVGGSRTGGDADGAGSRVQMVKPVALWSGLVEVPTSGKTRVHFDIPGYRGQLRVMAISSDRGHIGHATAAVTVRDPIVLETTLPRFLVTGDVAWVPVMLSNMSGAAQEVTVAVKVSELAQGAAPDQTSGTPPPPPIVLVDRPTAPLHLAVGETRSVVLQLRARQIPGAAHIEVTATAGKLVSKEALDLPIVPDAGLAHATRTMRAEEGENLVELGSWLPNSDRTTVWITANPYADALTHLRYLIRYPNGCLEQTSSMTRPLLYVSKIIGDVDPDAVADGGVDKKLQAGLDRILSLQTPSGGFSLWPGGTEPILFGSAYAIHILYDARKLSYKVPDTALADAIDWLDRNARGDGGFDELGMSRGYLYYVLAHVGKPHTAEALAILDRMPAKITDSEQEEERMLLMAAVQAGGDHRFASQLQDVDTSPISLDRKNNWSHYSDVRRRGISLAVFEDLFGTDPAAVPLADLVATQLSARSQGYWATQELGWGITGLGKFVSAPPKGVTEPILRWDGKPVALAQSRAGHEGSWTWQLTGATSAKRLTVEIPKGAGDRLSIVTSTEGVQPSQELPIGGEGLELQREVINARGEAIDLMHHRVGELLFVRLTLTNQTRKTIENIALADAIPGGWEIENPRLGRGSLPDWANAESLWSLDYMDLKDDGYHAFGKLDPMQSVTVIYAVRAVTAGSFTLRSAAAEAMYDMRIWARTPAWKARIQADWAEVN